MSGGKRGLVEVKGPTSASLPMAADRIKMHILGVANEKGGVGKTTTAVNLGVCLHALGYNVLLCDLDAQGHVSVALGVSVAETDPTILDLLRGTHSPEQVVKTYAESPRLDIWPSAIDLSGIDREFAGKPSGYHLFKEALSKVDGLYDFCIVDCPRALGLATSNALVSADSYVIPVVPGLLSLDGIRQLENTAAEIKKYLNQRLKCLGILLAKADKRTRLTRQTESVLRETFGGLLFSVTIYERVRYADAVSDGQPIEPAPDEPYMQLTKEVIQRVEQTPELVERVSGGE